MNKEVIKLEAMFIKMQIEQAISQLLQLVEDQKRKIEDLENEIARLRS